MKNLSKEQLSVIAASLLSILFLAFQAITIDYSMSEEDLKTKYRPSIDSVMMIDSVITQIASAENKYNRDVFNFKLQPKKARIQKTSDGSEPVAVKTRWINSKDLELYPKSVISYSLFFNGKARFTINGVTKEYNVGDELKVGDYLTKEVVVGTNEPTGNTKKGNSFTGKIISVNERSVYVESNDKDRVIRFRPGADSDYYAKNLIQDASGTETQTPQTPTDTRGGRPPRR
jgi:hypothetical protein